MKHVSILVPRGHTSLVNIEGTHQILTEVNGILTSLDREPLFDVHLVGLDRSAPQETGLFTVHPDLLVGDVTRTDLVIVPATFGKQVDGIRRNRAFVPWIVARHRAGADVASLCMGAFFLAATGLLDGRPCSTHWMHASEFRAMFPAVDLVEDRILTESGGLYTSGGAYSALNLVLHLIERYAGREVAVLTSKAFMIDIERHDQSPFIIFQGQRDHDDDVVKAVQDHVEGHFERRLPVADLASLAGVGRRSLERRFKKATGNTLREYVQRVKVEAAKKRFEQGDVTVFDVMDDVGYADIKAFRRVFKRTTGMTPTAYRTRYQRAARPRDGA